MGARVGRGAEPQGAAGARLVGRALVQRPPLHVKDGLNVLVVHVPGQGGGTRGRGRALGPAAVPAAAARQRRQRGGAGAGAAHSEE